MNVLRKLSTLIKAMASRGTGDRPAEAPPQVHGAGVVPAAEEAPQAEGERPDVLLQPLDRSRVADLLEQQQVPDKDTPAQRKKGDRP